MSAFVCNDDHFKVLALFAIHRRFGGSRRVSPLYINRIDDSADTLPDTALATLYATILHNENIRSYNYRYQEKDGEAEITVTGRDAVKHSHAKAVTILKMCDCLEYQSCETPDYQESTAYQLVEAIRKAAIRCLPGYDDAPWEYRAAA